MSLSVESEEFDRLFSALLEECRDTCLWFMSLSGFCLSEPGRGEILRQIELHGTRDQFVRARSLRKWL